jgi:hypothetical protein
MMGDGVAAVVATRNLIENFVATSFRRCAQSLGLLVVFTIVLTSCGGSSSSGGSGSGPAPTATLSASPTTIANAPGQSSTLTVSSTNANSCTVNNGGGQVGCNGSTSVSPTTTTTYTLTATGPGGSTTAEATVTVDAGPTITAFTATSTSIDAGQSTTLSVTATGATQVVISDNQNSTTYALSATGGTQLVSPTVTTTYLATATGVNGSSTVQSLTINVEPTTTATMSASPTPILMGQSSTLTFSSVNANSGIINPGANQVGINGTFQVSPTTTTTYTYTATGPGGTATATATVTVNPITSFQGIDASQAEGGTTEDDIDPNGAVGTKQFMEYVNTSYQGYDKTTFAPVWSSPQPIGTPWNGLPNQNCAASSIELDVVIIFDRLASRWVIAGKSTRGSQNKGDYYFCIAVSNTDDLASPTFAWYAYLFDLVPILGSNASGPYYPDWPKIGTWPTSADGNSSYVITMDMEDEASQDELGVAVCGLNRNDLLTGNNSNSELTVPGTLQCFVDTSSLLSGTPPIYIGHSLMPPDVDGNGNSTQPPPAGRDAFLASIENPTDPFSTNGPTTSSTINLWDLHLDWTTPTNSTFALLTPSPVTTYWPGCYTSASPAQTICVPELGQGGGLYVDSVGDRFMPRFSYRNFGSYESFLISHTVQIGPGKNNCGTGCQPQLAQQTGIRWYELRANGSGTPTVSQQGTIAYNDSFFRFLPSISQDQNGNAAVGYSISNPLNNPGISLSYWNLNPVNTNQPTEVTILNGAGEEIPFNPLNGDLVSSGQWGSYAMISVDPVDDCTFWYVNEYWPTTDLSGEPATWATNIAYFQIPGCQ